MLPYPDLGASGAKYMQLSAHATEGLEAIKEFWGARGTYPESVAIARYTPKAGLAHIVSVEWLPSHRGCADIYISVWPGRTTAKLFPRLRLSEHRLRVADFLAFIELLRQLKLAGGLRARFAFPQGRPPKEPPGLPRNIRSISLSFEALDEENNPVLMATQRRTDDGWEIVFEPAGRIEFPASPNAFFVEPSSLLSALAPTVK